MNKNLNFAMTFPPEKYCIIALLGIADGVTEWKVDDISSYTGIPQGKSSGKVKPTINYAEAMGLITCKSQNGGYVFSKTSLGELINQEDYGLNELLTLQLLNYFLSSRTIGSVVWYEMMRDYTIRKDSNKKVIDNLSMQIKFQKDFGKEQKEQARVVGPFKSAHSSFFEELSLCYENTAKEIEFSSLAVNKRFIYMYAYTLIYDWERLFSTESEISFENIINDISWGLGFQWDNEVTFSVLELLEHEHIIKINKQLAPMTIIKNISSQDILYKIYSLL